MFGKVHDTWDSGKTQEVHWWLAHLRSTIGQDKDFLARARGETEFHFERFLPKGLINPKVLDVGSGPVTQVGMRHDSLSVDIVAVDPLAVSYDEILSELGIEPVVRTRYGEAESLSQQFASDTFDFAYCRNALDHSYHPVEGIWQTIKVLKPGAKFFLCGYVNEGLEGRYEGLHQWNFDVRSGRLNVWRPGVSIEVVEAFQGEVEISEAVADDRWYMVTFSKPNSL